MRDTPFIKMHGLGNDFVVIDARARKLALDETTVRVIADRHLGVGCDQLLVLEKPKKRGADVFMRIRNADGSEAEACGNGARCVADLVMREKGKERITIETVAGLLEASAAGEQRVGVDMGQPRLAWREIPLARDCDTLNVPLSLGPLVVPVCTSMGNPHATFFVADAESVPLAELGPKLEHDPLFPARANIGVAQILSRERLRLRVWERGAGITPACGTGACAALVAASRRGLAARRAEVIADGGTLAVTWREDGHVLLTGAVAESFRGTLDPSLLGGR
jgi:diaminopimelate epimerase